MGQTALGQMVMAQIDFTVGEQPLPEWTVKCRTAPDWTHVEVRETDTVRCKGDS